MFSLKSLATGMCALLVLGLLAFGGTAAASAHTLSAPGSGLLFQTGGSSGSGSMQEGSNNGGTMSGSGENMSGSGSMSGSGENMSGNSMGGNSSMPQTGAGDTIPWLVLVIGAGALALSGVALRRVPIRNR